MARKNKCSVLMCVYAGDEAEYFTQAAESMLKQTMGLDDLVIVVDGPIGRELDAAIKKLERENRKIVQVVRLAKNVGIGAANNEGLKHCKHDLIAKMDADDIAVPERLEWQLSEFEKDPELVLLGGQLAEFDGDLTNVVSHRWVPTDQAGIRKFAKRRSPFNNQTVMYRKEVVLAAGGYPSLNRAEDYYLFARIIKDGRKVRNLGQVLVYFRLDEKALLRRKTWEHTKETILARNEIRRLGLANYWDLFLVAMAQMLIFIMPRKFTKYFYRRLRQQ